MEGEIKNLTVVWTWVVACLVYSHLIGKVIPKGTKRLLAILPVICLFLFLPLILHSALGGGLTYFFIVWLGTFKILLFAFDQGPLSTKPPLSLAHFISLGCFPIKFQQNQHYKLNSSKNRLNSSLKYAVKALVLATFSTTYKNKERLPPNILLTLYSIYLYLMLETLVLSVGSVTQAFLGVEIEPQFNEPYLCTSLQDFWGRRWNLMVSSILRPTVYIPVIKISSCAFGRKWGTLTAVVATFFVSGLMHELIFYYIGRQKPTWELTSFFLLHGFALAVEIVVKKAIGNKWQMPCVVSRALALAFVLFTALWLFLPSLTKGNLDVKVSVEMAAIIDFVRSGAGTLGPMVLNSMKKLHLERTRNGRE